MTPRLVEVRSTPEELAQAVAVGLGGRIASAQAEHGDAHIVLTGGGIGTAVMAALANLPLDWSRIDVWWGDERFLAQGHPDRNVTQARQVLLDRVPVPAEHVHAMPADHGQGVEEAAADYADQMSAASRDGLLPRFDVLLLGVGPEGHVASIFPASPAAHAAAPVVAVHDCPKPPPTRLTMTFPTIRSAREVWLMAAGTTKATAIADALRPGTDPVDVPAAGATGQLASITWLDQAAAAGIPSG